MSIEIINRKAAEDRRSVPLNPSAPATVLAGQIVQIVGGYAVLADGTSVVAGPMWAFTASARLDSSVSKSLTVVEAPFTALVNNDCYVGTPAAGDALALGTGGNVGKLVVQAVNTASDLQSVVAYCLVAPDADSKIKIKAIR